eukprot:m.364197 g.364197  ORF g.364197 m.364197 type:complete len:166 (+) comp25945_c0_seq1:324-821(+)
MEWQGLATVDGVKVLYQHSLNPTFDPASFHRTCDHEKYTFVVWQVDNYLFGGFTAVGYKGQNDVSIKDPSAFLFTLVNPHGIPPTRYNVRKQKPAITDDVACGPLFGGLYAFGFMGGCDILSFVTPGNVIIGFPQSFVDTTGLGKLTFTGQKKQRFKDMVVFRFI